jgi:hypothetical protein
MQRTIIAALLVLFGVAAVQHKRHRQATHFTPTVPAVTVAMPTAQGLQAQILSFQTCDISRRTTARVPTY